MKNPPFVYHRPDTLDDALALLAEHGDDAKVLAGGQSLLPVMALRLGRPEHIVDIGRIPGLDTLSSTESGTHIGASVRHRDAEFSDDVARHAPIVHQAMPYVGHRAIRNRGTVVGSIAHADPAAEMPAVCLAADATMVASSADGQREIAAADFFQGYLTSALEPEEILTEVRFPGWGANDGSAVVEIARRHGDYALVGLAVKVTVEDDAITTAALSFLGVDSMAVRVAAAEASLAGKTPSDEVFAEAATIVSAELDPPADVHGTSAYRKHIAGVLTEEGLARACTAAAERSAS